MNKIFIAVLLFLALGFCIICKAEDFDEELILDAPEMVINIESEEEILEKDNFDVKKEYDSSKNVMDTYVYTNDGEFTQHSATFQQEKRVKNIDFGAKSNTTFSPDNAKQKNTIYSKMHLNDKFTIDTSYSSNSSLQSDQQIDGTLSVAPEYRFNKHLSVQNVYSKDTNNGMSKEEVKLKLNPFKDSKRMDLDVGVGQVQYNNGVPSSSQVTFGTNFRF